MGRAPSRRGRGNLEKTYLHDLAARGVRVPPSVVVDADAQAIAGALDRLQLTDAVIKPTVGASGVAVERVARGREAETLTRLRGVRRSTKLLVQKFVPEVTAGEVAGVFLGGVFSHGLRRVPTPGEFRVNSQYGGRLEATTLDGSTVAAMSRIVGLLPQEPLYARIDGVCREEDFVLMEVEVNEPGLGLDLAPESGERFARVLLDRLRAA
jgi:glutathione synthase/RimK-type ligase-like ATP-grasp enzyme